MKIMYPWISYRRRKEFEGKTTINVLKTFPIFIAHGWGLYPIRAKLTMQSINQVIPALAEFSETSDRNIKFTEELNKSFYGNDNENQGKLKELFDKHGSDKGSSHNYYKIYADLIHKINDVGKIFEIGLGTNNTDIVSTMGKGGKPGASLRAFRDYGVNHQVYGADFDKRILFQEERIETFFVDQTDPETFSSLLTVTGIRFDLMIDDGLHSPNANLHSLKFFLENLKIGGCAVIEDIDLRTKPIWQVVSHLIEPKFESAFIETKLACMFIARRVI